jgi:hypothetical protein
MYCSPNKKLNDDDFTCFDIDSLIAIAKAFNQWTLKICNKGKCINKNTLKKITIPEGQGNEFKKRLYTSINDRLSQLCSDEYCWADLDFINSIRDTKIRNEIKKFTFKPKTTKTNRTWLNTNNINEVIKQYQILVNNEEGKDTFLFLGAQPSDISRVIKIDFKNLQKKYKTVAIVFNNDRHNQPGSHWVSAFIDNVNHTIEYFDSLGKAPNKYIKEFLNKFKKYDLVINKIEHQKGGNNCGIYSCYFIIQKLKGKTFNEINARLITDSMMTKYRDDLFRPL